MCGSLSLLLGSVEAGHRYSRERGGNPSTRAISSAEAFESCFMPPKCVRASRGAGSDPLEILEPARLTGLRALGAHAVMAKRWASSRISAMSMSARLMVPSTRRLAAHAVDLGKIRVSETHLAALARLATPTMTERSSRAQ